MYTKEPDLPVRNMDTGSGEDFGLGTAITSFGYAGTDTHPVLGGIS